MVGAGTSQATFCLGHAESSKSCRLIASQFPGEKFSQEGTLTSLSLHPGDLSPKPKSFYRESTIGGTQLESVTVATLQFYSPGPSH